MQATQIPQFQSNWTNQMGEWLDQATANMNKGEVYDYLRENWEAICDSWGDKSKWYRVISCLRSVNKLRELDADTRRFIVNDLSSRSHEWNKR